MRIVLLIKVNVKVLLVLIGISIHFCSWEEKSVTVLVETFEYNVTAVPCLCYFGCNCVVSKRKKLIGMRSDRDDHPLKKGEL